MVPPWNEPMLPTVVSKLKGTFNDLKGIFKADEFGLFHQCLPNNTYDF